MADVPLETKRGVIESIALDQGVAEATLEKHWEQWANEGELLPEAGASTKQIKQWFAKHLASLGVIQDSSNRFEEDAGGGGIDNDNDNEGELVHFDDYNYDDCINAETGVDSAKERRNARLRVSMADPHLSDKQFLDKLLQRQRAASPRARPAGGGFRQRGGGALISDETYAEAERKLMDSLLKEAKLSQQNAGKGFGLKGDNDLDEVAPAGQALTAGKRIPRHELGTGRLGTAARKFTLGKVIGHWAIRHRNAEAHDAYFTGMQIGGAIALRVAKENYAFGRVRKHPISAGDIKARHSAIIRTLLEGIQAAGRTSEAAEEYAKATMAVIQQEIREYARGVGTISSQFGAKAGDSLPAGSLVGRVRSLAKGAKRKGRALLNEGEKRVIINQIISLANWAISVPGERRVGAGFGRDRFVTSLIERFGDNLHRVLTSETKGSRIARHDGASYAVISMLQGAITAFIEHPRLYPYIPDLLAVAERRLGQLNPLGYQEEEEERELPAVPADAQALASLLVDKARAYLKRNESLAKRAGARYVLMVPADKKCLAKVQNLIGDSDGADKYVKNGLLAPHPNTELDKSGHLISMAGSVLHLKATNEDNNNDDDSHNSLLRLRQMRRAGLNPSHMHDDPWDRESKNVGGAIEPMPSRLPMDCVPSEAPASPSTGTASKPNYQIRILYYWPQDEARD